MLWSFWEESVTTLLFQECDNITYEGVSNSLPIYLCTDSDSSVTGCFILAQKTLVADSPGALTITSDNKHIHYRNL